MWIYQDLMLLLLMMGMLLRVLRLVWLMRPELVKRTETLSRALLNILYMRSVDAFFAMALGM